MDNQEKYRHASMMEKHELLKTYNSSDSGISMEQAQASIQSIGRNVIMKKKTRSIRRQIAHSFITPFTLLLLSLSVLSFIADYLLSTENKNLGSSLIILGMVLLSGVINFIESYQSNKALESLGKFMKTNARVYRNSASSQIIDSSELTVGDVIELSSGDLVPADIRILESRDLFLSTAILTGESNAVERNGKVDTDDHALFDRMNLAFWGETILSGEGKALVISIGNDTILGAMEESISHKRPQTSFEKGISYVSKLLIRFMIVMVPGVFLLSGLHSGNWLEAFLFALSVAVGLTPAMLPTVLATGLSKGATKLSKQKVIVKELSAIQSLGSIDTLCTDKTGTLTEDRITVMQSLDIKHQESDEVVEKAFLNSYYHTGLVNQMDQAIIDYGIHLAKSDLQSYQKVDEIPFDFERRRMSVAVRDSLGNLELITKGAIEEILGICTQVKLNNETIPIDDSIRDDIRKYVKNLGESGLRVLGVAYKSDILASEKLSLNNEQDMVLLGILTFLDPPKASAQKAIQALAKYHVKTKILTGDDASVTRAVCAKVGINVETIITGKDIDTMTEAQLKDSITKYDVFAKLTPQQKALVIKNLKELGHAVGYMGDGVNDALAMRESDVAISVDTAVDIAKDSADIILLDKDLDVLQQGILEGRKIFTNIVKYLKMTISANFGNMFSVLIASMFLPFIPMLPVQLLVLNLIYDISCLTLPWDNVDEDYLLEPHHWDGKSIKTYMLWLGPTSSIFDIFTFMMLFLWILPQYFQGSYTTLTSSQQILFQGLFHTAWFLQSLWSQSLIINLIRTEKIPFIESKPSHGVLISTLLGILIGSMIPYTLFASYLGMVEPLTSFFILLGFNMISYSLTVSFVKRWYVKRYGSLYN
ncbi:magnesium-translocating P-type ATPase [Erysipelothrix sp. HDW6A]|uniref:magnesium-translocating P-type ATPase n=1 Tax=Erysipelothrix sp. HDW6A TaxID=2714928 RepID=UPI00140D3465|nr:magnesium-translocating P-type ATPase [Erysipelothrix sp. HDW6A]QIK58164.1 magnesium-translocating P-type ATPase [Erysipelothrix sp. HDW6A]